MYNRVNNLQREGIHFLFKNHVIPFLRNRRGEAYTEIKLKRKLLVQNKGYRKHRLKKPKRKGRREEGEQL
jgi:hypothetical protein